MLSSFLICLTLISGTFVQDNSPTVEVTGRIVYEDTGQPAARNRVQLIPAGALLNAHSGVRLPTAITDERGEFSLRHIGAGEYYVLTESVDQRGSQLTSILTRSNDSAAGVGVITGRVLSQTGDKPVASAELMLRRTGTFTMSAAPGNYLVIAWRPADGPGALANAMNKATRAQGTGITLSANDRKEIDIRLP
jgi:hypothetical protein